MRGMQAPRNTVTSWLHRCLALSVCVRVWLSGRVSVSVCGWVCGCVHVGVCRVCVRG